MKYQGTFGAFNSYIDVGDGCWRRIVLVTDLANRVNILHPCSITNIRKMSPMLTLARVDIWPELTTANCPS